MRALLLIGLGMQACGEGKSPPLEQTCDWGSGDPGDLVSTGNAIGDTIENLLLTDQCGQEVHLWDFAGMYHVLLATEAN